MPTEEESTTQSCAEERDEVGAEETQQRRTPRNRSEQEMYVEESLLDKELEILRRERDIMRRELEILRRDREAEANMRLMASPATVASQSSTMRNQPKALSKLLSEFSVRRIRSAFGKGSSN